MRKKVLLIDLDFQAGQDMARMLNVSPRHAIADLLPVIEKAEDPEMISEYAAKYSPFLDFLPAVRNTRQIGHISPDNIKPFLKKVTPAYDFIIIDAGKAFSETLITVLDYSNLILLVATPRWSAGLFYESAVGRCRTSPRTDPA